MPAQYALGIILFIDYVLAGKKFTPEAQSISTQHTVKGIYTPPQIGLNLLLIFRELCTAVKILMASEVLSYHQRLAVYVCVFNSRQPPVLL